jgi:hypothetical protein
MTNTATGVRPFCQCTKGRYGPNCELEATCTTSSCPTSRICNNEGRCVCPAGFSGDSCTATTTCKLFQLFLKFGNRDPISADNLLIVVAALGGVDASTLTVTGPNTKDGVSEYDIKFCASADVDPTKSLDTFQKNLAGSGLPVTDAPAPAGSSASTLLATLGVTAAALVVAL